MKRIGSMFEAEKIRRPPMLIVIGCPLVVASMTGARFASAPFDLAQDCLAGVTSLQVDRNQPEEQGPIESTEQEIDDRRARLFEADSGTGARRDRIDSLIEFRQQLIDQYPFHQRAPVWKGDQAFDLLFLALPEHVNILEVEFGLPANESLTEFTGIVRRAWALADDAAIGIADAILDIEESPDFHDDVRLQQQRRHLMQFEQRERIPFLLATAEYYRALSTRPRPQWPNGTPPAANPEETSDSADGPMAQFRDVLDASSEVDLLLDEPWRTQVRAMASIAAVAVGDVDQAARILNQIDDRSTLDRLVRFRVSVAGRTIEDISGRGSSIEALKAQRDQAQRSIPSWIRSDAYLLLVACDLEFAERLDLITGETRFGAAESRPSLSGAFESEAQRNEWLLSAYDPFLNNDDLSLSRASREQLAGEHIARAIPPTVATDRLPALVVIAQAAAQLQNPESHDRAVEALRFLMGRSNVASWVHPRAAYLLAADAYQAGNVIESANALLQVASKWPDSNEARQSAEQAAVIAIDALRTGDSLQPDEQSALTAVLDHAAQLLTDRFSNAPDYAAVMYHRGVLELKRKRFSTAIESFHAVPSDSPVYPDAALELVQAYREYADQLQSRGPSVVAEKHRALRGLIKTAEDACELFRERSQNGSDPTRRTLAERRVSTLLIMISDAHLQLEEPQKALDTLGGIDEEPSGDPAMFGQILRVRVEALRALGRSEEADKELGELARQNPDLALPVLDRIVLSIYEEAMRLERSGATDESLHQVAGRLRPLAERTLQILQTRRHVQGDGEADAMMRRARFHVAESYRLSGELDEAKRRLQGLNAEYPDSATILTSYAECLFAMHLDAEAMRAYAQVSSSLIDQRNWMFWQAELRTLQMLDRNQRNTERIFPRIQRLRQYDPNLGGDQFRPAFQILETRYAP